MHDATSGSEDQPLTTMLGDYCIQESQKAIAILMSCSYYPIYGANGQPYVGRYKMRDGYIMMATTQNDAEPTFNRHCYNKV